MKPFGLARVTILIVVILIAVFQSGYLAVIAPIGEGADEWEHVDQALHFAVERRLPDLATEDVGQAQHPPLAYLIMAGIQSLAGVDESPARAAGGGVDILGRRVLWRPSHRQVDDDTLAEGRPERYQQRLLTRDSTFLAMRGFGILLGLLTAILFVFCVREFFPDQPSLVLGTASFILLLPQWAAQFAFISCDPYLSFLVCLATWLALRARRLGQLRQWQKLIPVAIVLGLAFLTKIHAIGIAAFLAFLVLGDRRSNPKLQGRLIAVGILAAGPLLIAGWWHLARVLAAGGPLVLDHHAALKPWLLRVQEFHPVILIDVLHQLLSSFFGVITASSISAPTFFFVVPMAVVVISLLGAAWPALKSERAQRPNPFNKPALAANETLAMPATDPGRLGLPISAALATLVFLTLLILVANQHYLHIHGRYYFAILPVLGIILGAGIQRLCGEKAAALLGFAALWNFVFLVWTIQVSMTQIMTISTSKYERGRVLAYYDCGHRHFDQAQAKGFEAVRQMRHLSLPRHSIRATPDESLSYSFNVSDPEKQLQVRLRYPDAALRGQGDLPSPSGLECFADGERLHGMLSIGLDRGELVYLVPQSLSADGAIEITWRNRAAGATGVALAEIWLEETWLQIEHCRLDAPSQTLSFSLLNLDEESSHGFAYHVEDRDGLIEFNTERQLSELAAGGRANFRLQLKRKADPASLTVSLRPDYLGPEVDFKLVYNRLPGVRRSGLVRLADIETLILDAESQAQDLTAADLDLVPGGRFDFGIETSRPEPDLIPKILSLDVEAAELAEPWTVKSGQDGMSLCSTIMTRKPHAPPFRFLLRLNTAPDQPIHLNRLIIRRRLDDSSWGQSYPIDNAN